MAATCNATTSAIGTQISQMESAIFRYSCANPISMIQYGDGVVHGIDILLDYGFYQFD